MKIRITADCLIRGQHTQAGTILECWPADAQNLLISGRAEAVIEHRDPEPVENRDPAPPARKGKTK